MTGLQYGARSAPISVTTHALGGEHFNAGAPGGRDGKAPVNGEVAPGTFEPWGFIELILRRWYWMLLFGVVLAVAGAYAGTKLWKPTYSATIKLLRLDPQNATEFYKPRTFSEQTYASLLRAPELLKSVAEQSDPKLSVEELNTGLLVTPMRDTEVVMAILPGDTPEAAVNLANLYGREAVRYTQKLQVAEAGEVNNSLKQQLAEMDADIHKLGQQLRTVPRTSAGFQTGGRIVLMQEKLQAAREELDNLLAKYTEIHPLVQEQRAKIAIIEKQLAETPKEFSLIPPHTPLPRVIGPTTSSLHPTNSPRGRTNITARQTVKRAGAPPTSDLEGDMLLTQLQNLAAARVTLASRQREAQTYADKAPGYCAILAPATPAEIIPHSPRGKIMFLGVLGFVLGFGGTLLLVMFVEILDERLKTADDLKRVSRLPIVATLGDLRHMSHSAQSHWAFRTWTALQSRLSLSPNHGLVCGLTCSTDGEGRSTWINLLAQAASECGFRVLTIATLPPPDPEAEADSHDADQRNGDPDEADPDPPPAKQPEVPVNTHRQDSPNTSTALTTSVLTSPAMVTQRLTGKDPQPYVHIPLPGWVWNLERRKQWQTALNQWSKIDNIVILVKLPPAATPEAVLLAENLPNLLWLADSKKAKAAISREQLQTLREARCHLVGAVLNREPAPPLKRRFSRWLGAWVLLPTLGLFLSQAQKSFAQTAVPALLERPLTPYEQSLRAATTNGAPSAPPALSIGPLTNEPVPLPTPRAAGSNSPAVFTAAAPIAQTNRSFSIIGPEQRAPWQKRLTLGPGDTLNFALFGQPDLTRTDVLVGPDGRVSYLQASGVLVTGLTVDELRQKLDEELSKYYRSPRTMITPVVYRSKKYYMLGKVVNRGVYVLEQPITLLEAVARAHGLETGLVDNQNSVDIADLQRSFLIRQGKRVPVDFEKLFLEGDLSQNIPMEPEDYLYFAAANLKEVYVLGEVNSPGVVTWTERTTVVGAIAARSGFTDKAFKGRVLVIRGSLNKPQTFIVNVWGALEASSFNFKLEPKDIIYVCHRPFIRVEEVLDLAATAFIQSAFSAWATDKVGPIINSPILP